MKQLIPSSKTWVRTMRGISISGARSVSVAQNTTLAAASLVKLKTAEV